MIDQIGLSIFTKIRESNLGHKSFYKNTTKYDFLTDSLLKTPQFEHLKQYFCKNTTKRGVLCRYFQQGHHKILCPSKYFCQKCQMMKKRKIGKS